MTPRRSGLAVALLVLITMLVACTTSASPSATADETAEARASAEPTPAMSPSATAEPPPSEDAEADEERVTIGLSDFEPAELTIGVGTVVIFENEATFDHTVTEGRDGQAVDDPIVDEEVEPGGEVRVTFDEPGTYDITCTIHPSMQMTITVED